MIQPDFTDDEMEQFEKDPSVRLIGKEIVERETGKLVTCPACGAEHGMATSETKLRCHGKPGTRESCLKMLIDEYAAQRPLNGAHRHTADSPETEENDEEDSDGNDSHEQSSFMEWSG